MDDSREESSFKEGYEDRLEEESSIAPSSSFVSDTLANQ